MSTPAKKDATYQDLLGLPPEMTGQIIDGDLYAMPRPAGRHVFVASLLGGDLHGPFQRGRGGPGGWWLIDEPEIHLAADIVVPDLAGWRRERMPSMPSPEVKFFTLCPDWVCEVLSPSTASFDRVKKRRVYETAKVAWLWYLDPLARTLEAYSWHDGQYLSLGSWGQGDAPRVAPFDAVPLDLDALWGTDDLSPEG